MSVEGRLAAGGRGNGTGALAPSSPFRRSGTRLSLAAVWNDAKLRGYVVQALSLAGFAVVMGWFAHNAVANMARMGVTSGFGFLSHPANFAIGESAIPYSSADSYGRAILVGLVNTLKVSLLSIVFATLFGTLLGVLRLSANPLLRGLVQTYVEIIRNTPLLLQLFFWYTTILVTLPGPRQALNPAPGVFLSNRGVRVPALDLPRPALTFGVVAICVAAIAALGWLSRTRRKRIGRAAPARSLSFATLALGAAAIWLFGGAPTFDMPAQKGFDFAGGAALSPEFAALLFGLVVYASAFISEIVRSGISSVPAGQREAARSLGLAWWPTMRLVILPQALRVIVPPLTSTYMALTKNSSLAVAIGYPDLVSVLNTTMNQTGQAVEAIALLMGTYLSLALSISLLMAWYNRRVAIKER